MVDESGREVGMSATPERNMARIAVIARVLTAPFVRYELHGQEYVADTHVGIIAANHRSFFDVPAGLIALHHFKRYPRLLVASAYFERRATRRFMRSIGAIPVDRERKSGTAASAAVEALQEGVPILVMPEGRLHWDPGILSPPGPRVLVCPAWPWLPTCPWCRSPSAGRKLCGRPLSGCPGSIRSAARPW